MTEKKEKIITLTNMLNEARKAYYTGTAIMSDKKYDDLFDCLVTLEEETGISMPDSPTKTVGTNVSESKLKKVTHETPALSLKKVKVTDNDFKNTIESFLNNKEGNISFKLDGLTTILTYDEGHITLAATRGNGYIGEDITENAMHFQGVPSSIEYKGHLVVRGESLITYSEFNRLNLLGQYKNPRNLASGTVRALDSAVLNERTVSFLLFNVVTPIPELKGKTKSEEYEFMQKLGFNVVPNMSGGLDAIERMTALAKQSDLPTDGLVLTYEDTSFAESLGSTGHHPKGSLAIKWGDETELTTIRNISWSLGRSGVLTPVAVFDPVEIEGTTVSKASLHNVSYIIENDIQPGDTVSVYKANMIIPQIAENISAQSRSNKSATPEDYNLPERCPCCKQLLSLSKEPPFVLECSNPKCGGKQIKRISHMCSRDALNIVGLSEETLSKIIDAGYISTIADVFKIDKRLEIANIDGLGIKSYDNLVKSIDAAKHCNFISFIHAMGIPMIGKGQAKLIQKFLAANYELLVENYFPQSDGPYDLLGLMVSMDNHNYDWNNIPGFGTIMSANLHKWIDTYLTDSAPDSSVKELLSYLVFSDKPIVKENSPLANLTIVITGTLQIYNNREALQKEIELLGGKVSGSVSSKTSYLINNDVNSSSGKNKKAKELNVPIISEEDFVKKFIKL